MDDGRFSGVLAVGWILQGQACMAETVMPQDVGSHTLRDFRLGRVCEAVDRRRIPQCVGLLKEGCAPWLVVATAEHTKMDDGRLVLVCSRSGGSPQRTVVSL
jgi:hypothetical protein